MTADAEKYAKEDEVFKQKVEAKNGLENYCYSMKSTLADGALAEKAPADGVEAARTAVERTLSWLEANQLAELDELEHMRKEVEAACAPVLQAAQGAPGSTPQGAAGSPTVEDVD
eukprot:5439324-Prymnesium_polylepis.1